MEKKIVPYYATFVIKPCLAESTKKAYNILPDNPSDHPESFQEPYTFKRVKLLEESP